MINDNIIIRNLAYKILIFKPVYNLNPFTGPRGNIFKNVIREKYFLCLFKCITATQNYSNIKLNYY